MDENENDNENDRDGMIITIMMISMDNTKRKGHGIAADSVTS